MTTKAVILLLLLPMMAAAWPQNATIIQGVPVSSTAPTDTFVLTYNGATKSIIWAAGGGSATAGLGIFVKNAGTTVSGTVTTVNAIAPLTFGAVSGGQSNLSIPVGAGSEILATNAGATAVAFETVAGDLTKSGATWTIGAGAVTTAKLDTATQNKLLPVVGGSGSTFVLPYGNGTWTKTLASDAAFQVPSVNSSQTAIIWGTLTANNLASSVTSLLLPTISGTSAALRMPYDNGSWTSTASSSGNDQIPMTSGSTVAWLKVTGDLTNSGGTFTVTNSAITSAKLATAVSDRLLPATGSARRVLYDNGGAWVATAGGSAAQMLVTATSGATPTWVTVSGDLTQSDGAFAIQSGKVTYSTLATGVTNLLLPATSGTSVSFVMPYDNGIWTHEAGSTTADQIFMVNSTNTGLKWAAVTGVVTQTNGVFTLKAGGVNLSNLSAGVTNLLLPAGGANGDTLYYDSSAWNRLAKGSNGQVLQLVAGLPSWSTVATGAPTFQASYADVTANATKANFIVSGGLTQTSSDSPTGTFNVTTTMPNGSGDLTGTWPNITIASNAITHGKILANAVRREHILDGEVVSSKLGADVRPQLVPAPANTTGIVVPYGYSDGVTGAWAVSNNGVADQILTVSPTETAAFWATATGDVTQTGGAFAVTAGAITAGKLASAVQNRLLPATVGPDGQVLTVVSGAAAWAAASGSGGGSVATSLNYIPTSPTTATGMNFVPTAGITQTYSFTGATFNVTTAMLPAAGDLTGTWPTITIASNAVTAAKIANATITSTQLASSVTDLLLPTGANGDTLYYNSGWQRLAKGANTQVLTLVSGLPAWVAPSGGGGGGGGGGNILTLQANYADVTVNPTKANFVVSGGLTQSSSENPAGTFNVTTTLPVAAGDLTGTWPTITIASAAITTAKIAASVTLTTPVLSNPTVSNTMTFTDNTVNADAARTLVANGTELSWGTAAHTATNLEQVNRKNAASGYAGLSAGSKLTASQGQEVWALADLSDVGGKTGSGTTVVMDTSPVITTPALANPTVSNSMTFTDNTVPSNAARVLVANGTELSWGTAAGVATNLEQVNRKNAASGYAGLDGATKLLIAQGQEVWGLVDLSDVASKSGSGNVVIMQGTPTLTTPILTNPTVSNSASFTDNTVNADAAGTLVRNGTELSWGTAAHTATNLEQVARKDAASGYAGLTGSTKLNIAQGQEVWALADLSDVTGKTGSSMLVVTDTGPSITSPILSNPTISNTTTYTDLAMNADAAGTLTRNGTELSWGTAAHTATNLEQVNRKNAANGYAGLTAGTKLNLAQMQEVMAIADLSDISGTTGSGTLAVLGTGPTLTNVTVSNTITFTNNTVNANTIRTLVANGTELSWGTAAGVATNLEQVARKNAASGYAGLDGSTKLALGQGQEVWALADLSDVTGKSGSGTTVIMDTSPTLATATLTNVTVSNTITFTNNTVNANTIRTLVANGTELSWGTAAGVATNLEQVARKNAASGYAGLDGSTKLALAQGQEVWALADLSDVTGKSGSGTIVIMQTTPTLTTPILTNPTVSNSATFTDNTVNADVAGVLVRNGTELSWGTAAHTATNLEQVGRKNAASGYAGLDGSTKLALAQGQEVWALADLSDVTAKSGSGTVAIMQTAPTLTNVTVSNTITLTDNTVAADTIRTLVANGTELSWGTAAHTATNLEQVNRKNAASGYAGLSAGSKLTASQGQEVWALADLTDVTATTGSGSTVPFATSPTLTTPSLTTPTVTNTLTAGGNILMSQYSTVGQVLFISTTAGTLGVTAQGAANTLLHGTAASTPTFSKLVDGDVTANTLTSASMASSVTNLLLPSGGTNGDTVYYNSGWTRLAKGSDTQVLTLASGIPSWADAAGGITNLGINGGTTSAPTTVQLIADPTDGCTVTKVLVSTTETVTVSGTRSTYKNRIINGEFLFDQRNEGTAATVNSTTHVYGPDRFQGFGTASAGVFTLTRVADSSAPKGFGMTLDVSVTTADASLASGDVYAFETVIEGANTRDLGFGTASASAVTLSFFAKTNKTGTFSGAISNSAGDRFFPFTYSLPVSGAWTRVSIILVGDKTGTWLTDNSAGIVVDWSLGCGSTAQATAFAWTGTSGKYAATGEGNLMSSNTQFLQMTGIQLEPGSIGTPFDYRQYKDELALCQRYYWKTYDQGVVVPTLTAVGALTIADAVATTHYDEIPVMFPVAMRAAPTMTAYKAYGTTTAGNFSTSGGNAMQVAFEGTGTRGSGVYNNAAGTLGSIYYGHVTADADY